MLDANDVAKYVIRYYYDKDINISNLKLQKVLYFLQAQHLVSTDEKLFYQDIEAWDFGPVVTEVFHKYFRFGGGSIFPCHDEERIYLSAKTEEIINPMLDKLANYSSVALMDLTLNQAPWRTTYRKDRHAIIPSYVIKNYFLD